MLDSSEPLQKDSLQLIARVYVTAVSEYVCRLDMEKSPGGRVLGGGHHGRLLAHSTNNLPKTRIAKSYYPIDRATPPLPPTNRANAEKACTCVPLAVCAQSPGEMGGEGGEDAATPTSLARQ